MQKSRWITLIPILLIGFFCEAQVIRVPFERGVEDEQFHRSQAIVPMYKFTGTSIESYSRFGLEDRGDLERYEIQRMPDMTGCTDTGYTYLYFSGADNKRSQAYLLTLVGNYVRSMNAVHFWVDRNNDLDFTNDGPPDTLGYYAFDLTIHMSNINDSNARYAVKLSRFKFGENVRYKRLLEEHYKANSGTKQFTKVNYSYREQRYNSIIARYGNGTDSFAIGLKDMNVNGYYNEPGLDMIYVGSKTSNIAFDRLRELPEKVKDNTFEWNGKGYRITTIDPAGGYFEFIEDSTVKIGNRLPLGKSTPNFKFTNILNKEHELKEYKKDQIYLFFWDRETLSPEDTTYLGLINRDFANKIKLITLNHGDEPKKVRITFYYDKLSFPVGYSDSEIAALYKLEDLTRGFYLDTKCRLLYDKITPKEMYELLKRKYVSEHGAL